MPHIGGLVSFQLLFGCGVESADVGSDNTVTLIGYATGTGVEEGVIRWYLGIGQLYRSCATGI